MRYSLTILFLALLMNGFSQGRFAIRLGTGVGQYKMNDLKDFQAQEEYASGDLLERVDNFPAYLFYSGEATVRISTRFSLGLIYRLQSTGCKSAYSDYSGVWRAKQNLKSDNAGLLVSFQLLTKDKFSAGIEGRVYYAWTTFEYKRQLQLYNNMVDNTVKANAKANSLMLNPDLSFSYHISKHISLDLTAGYCFDFKGQVDNLPTFFPDWGWLSATREYDWSGYRIGLSTSYKF